MTDADATVPGVEPLSDASQPTGGTTEAANPADGESAIVVNEEAPVESQAEVAPEPTHLPSTEPLALEPTAAEPVPLEVTVVEPVAPATEISVEPDLGDAPAVLPAPPPASSRSLETASAGSGPEPPPQPVALPDGVTSPAHASQDLSTVKTADRPVLQSLEAVSTSRAKTIGVGQASAEEHYRQLVLVPTERAKPAPAHPVVRTPEKRARQSRTEQPPEHRAEPNHSGSLGLPAASRDAPQSSSAAATASSAGSSGGIVFLVTALLALFAAEIRRLLSLSIASGRSVTVDFGLKRPG